MIPFNLIILACIKKLNILPFTDFNIKLKTKIKFFIFKLFYIKNHEIKLKTNSKVNIGGKY